MKLPVMPRNIRRLAGGEKFAFACHSGVSCFTHCCRQLDLALTPYDVLRLKNGLKLTSSEFLDRYVIVEHEDDDIFPRCYLTMVDDGKASCVFVNQHGCSVYSDRPGACRAYPLGRATMRNQADNLEEFYVLLNEDHCKGFEENASQTPQQYGSEQGLEIYNRMNDALIAIMQHEKVRRGMRPTQEQRELYLLALYDLDTFRERLFTGQLGETPARERADLEDDAKLLLYSIEWLEKKLFAEAGTKANEVE